MQNRIKIWGAQIRGNFLILSVLLVAIGLSLSALHIKKSGTGDFSLLHAFVLVVGVVLAHVAVNLFNEYSDHKTGIDLKTDPTPFSGGSKMIQSGLTDPKAVFTAAMQILFFAFLIGLYFCLVSHWILLIVIAVGGIAVYCYTGYLAKWLVGEIFAGMTLGSLVVVGTYIAMTGNPGMPLNELLNLEVVLVSIPPGILTFLLLLLNEFPDADVDREGGRFHLVIWLGKKKAAYLYSFGLALVYLLMIVLPVMNITTWWILLTLLTLPLSLKAAITAIKYGSDRDKLIPALGLNVVVVLATDAILAISFLLSMKWDY